MKLWCQTQGHEVLLIILTTQNGLGATEVFSDVTAVLARGENVTSYNQALMVLSFYYFFNWSF